MFSIYQRNLLENFSIDKKLRKMFKFSSIIFGALIFHTVYGQYPEIVSDDSNFVNSVTDSLSLIESMAPDVLNFINTHVGRIQEWDKSGMCSWCNPPTYQLANTPANLEKYWLASTIAHDSFHSYLYQRYKNLNDGAEPDYNLFSGFDAERQCNQYQMEVLQKIGAPQNVIDYMATLDGKHCDLNGDGVCDEKDYALMNWKK